MIALVTGWFNTLWPKIALVGAVILALVGVYAAIRKSGGDAERAKQLKEGLDRIRKANDAAAKIDNSTGAIDHDPDNLDIHR